MSSRIGGAIKVIAWIFLAAGVILCLSGGAGAGPGHKLLGPAFWTVLLQIAAVAACAALLYGFGELIDATRRNAQANAEMLELLRKRLRQGGAESPAQNDGQAL